MAWVQCMHPTEFFFPHARCCSHMPWACWETDAHFLVIHCSTFVIETRHGFNSTTVRTFVMDVVKSVRGILLAFVTGAMVSAADWQMGHQHADSSVQITT